MIIYLDEELSVLTAYSIYYKDYHSKIEVHMRSIIWLHHTIKLKVAILIFGLTAGNILAQQINIPRIEQMPNIPAPYEMRDWRQVTLEYDNFVFDFNKTGLYLPLIWWRTNTINYPSHNSFGLHTVVGTNFPGSGEAINVLPAVISASLVGIDKSNQNGNNWALMCEEYFNKANGANVYRNHPSSGSWNDWWYDTMPNVFFYQLYDLFPHTGDFDFQLRSVADRWLAAIRVMGGSSTPWNVPYMNYRAFNLMTMTPYSATPTEPEAAGALAWILYNAFLETGVTNYRIGAEWALEFLDNWNTNPSYELQLPYGAHIAARMNAELGTTYDIQKLVNWCFTTTGNVRNWGAIVGNWGGYECSGLIGEVSSNDYAFTMNTFEQVGALVPLVRYDERFARAIGKWVLNAANASRLYYPNYLPDINQDSELWAHQYDSSSVIGHEALHEYDPHNPPISPYATGDAISGGWGNTNLALYGSSHVGIMGSIIDTTDVEMILVLDALKTDYFHSPAYPTYLVYNPLGSDTSITMDLGPTYCDLYDGVTNNFVLTNVAGPTSVPIPADQARVMVLTPTGGTISYYLDQMLIDGVVVDFHSGQMVSNYPPRIKGLTGLPELVLLGQNSTVFCTATDRDGDSLNYIWSTNGGSITGTGTEIIWSAPSLQGIYRVYCTVDDYQGAWDSASVAIQVVQQINNNPVIEKISASPRKIDLGETSSLSCQAMDPDGDTLSYSWYSEFGVLIDSGATATWMAPMIAGNYYITCQVTDGNGGEAIDSIGIVVRDFSNVQTGKLVAYYPFSGNANDASGNDHHGTVYGAALTPDRLGNPNSAYYFDGINDYIRIPNHDSLNFRQAMTVNFWMNIAQLYTREAFPISHGSWENRWKVSIIPEHKLRWTIKTNNPSNNGIIDLDTETELVENSWHNYTIFYDGADFEIYIDGELDNFALWSGLILQTSIDMTIGQMLPNNSNYNFRGMLDEIRIYNYGLSVDEIRNLASGSTGILTRNDSKVPSSYNLWQNYPNPFNSTTIISWQLPVGSIVKLTVYDITGQKIAILVNEEKPAGSFQVLFDASGLASGLYLYRLETDTYIETRKMILMK
jgi:hypothetical protein